LTAAFGLTLALTSAAFGQTSGAAPTLDRTINTRPVPSGAKVKFRGVIVNRDADTFIIRDAGRADTQVLLTDQTSIKTHGGWFRGGKKYPVTDLLTGLIVEVEGRGEAAAARETADLANERITALDDYDVQETVVVNFRLNSAVLTAEARQQLDAIAAKAGTTRGYMIEVAGHTDATGNASRNFQLSRQRADAVVQYLVVNHKLPPRRFVTPTGYGKTEAVADNTTASGRAQNRRVEVRLIINRGMSRPAQITSAPRP
jgi:outer membrane protein OmpA-like peptidoglycan-associated protein